MDQAGGGLGEPDPSTRCPRPPVQRGRLSFATLVPEGCRSSVLTTFRLLPGLTYDALHDAMKRQGYIIYYAGQGDLRIYAFRVANLGILTPRDMEGVVAAFADSLRELGLASR